MALHFVPRKPRAEQIKELEDKGELTKEEEIRRTAIEHAIQDLKRVLGERSEDADPDKPKEREGKREAVRRPDVSDERAQDADRSKPATSPDASPDEALGDDPRNQQLGMRIAELEKRLAELRRNIRSADDPVRSARLFGGPGRAAIVRRGGADRSGRGKL